MSGRVETKKSVPERKQIQKDGAKFQHPKQSKVRKPEFKLNRKHWENSRDGQTQAPSSLHTHTHTDLKKGCSLCQMINRGEHKELDMKLRRDATNTGENIRFKEKWEINLKHKTYKE